MLKPQVWKALVYNHIMVHSELSVRTGCMLNAGGLVSAVYCTAICDYKTV